MADNGLTDEFVPHRQPLGCKHIHRNSAPSDDDEDYPDVPFLDDIVWMVEFGDSNDHGCNEIGDTGETKPPSQSANARGAGRYQSRPKRGGTIVFSHIGGKGSPF